MKRIDENDKMNEEKLLKFKQDLEEESNDK